MLVKIGKIAEFGDYGSTMFTVKSVLIRCEKNLTIFCLAP